MVCKVAVPIDFLELENKFIYPFFWDKLCETCFKKTFSRFATHAREHKFIFTAIPTLSNTKRGLLSSIDNIVQIS